MVCALAAVSRPSFAQIGCDFYSIELLVAHTDAVIRAKVSDAKFTMVKDETGWWQANLRVEEVLKGSDAKMIEVAL